MLQEQSLSVTAVCEVLQVSRSAFYAWQQAEPTVHEDRDESLLPHVNSIFHQHRRRYGTRRIVAELRDRDQICDDAESLNS